MCTITQTSWIWVCYQPINNSIYTDIFLQTNSNCNANFEGFLAILQYILSVDFLTLCFCYASKCAHCLSCTLKYDDIENGILQNKYKLKWTDYFECIHCLLQEHLKYFLHGLLKRQGTLKIIVSITSNIFAT